MAKKNGVVGESHNLPLLIVGILVVALFLLPVINLGQAFAATGHATATGTSSESFVVSLFTKWEEGNVDLIVAKYIFFAILALLVYSSLSAFKIPKNMALQWFIAIPVAFLTTAFVTRAEVFTILTTYTALGITLGAILPFIVLMFFSSMMLSSGDGKTTVGKVMLQFFLWVVYFGVLGYKLIGGLVNGDLDIGLNITFIALLALVFLSFIIILFNKRFRHWVMTIGLELRHAEAEYEKENVRRAQELASQVQHYGSLDVYPSRK